MYLNFVCLFSQPVKDTEKEGEENNVLKFIRWNNLKIKSSKTATRSQLTRKSGKLKHSSCNSNEHISEDSAVSLSNLDLDKGMTRNSSHENVTNKSEYKKKCPKKIIGDCHCGDENNCQRRANLSDVDEESLIDCNFEKQFAQGVSVLTAHALEQDEKERKREDWKFASEVLDRVFKLLFLFAFIILHLTIFLCT